MAQSTYLQLTNKVLGRITQAAITDVTAATGHALIITNLINEAQNQLFLATDWYSLYVTRTFVTASSTAEYAQATDWGRTIDMMDESNNRVLVESFNRSFDEADPDSDTEAAPTHFTVTGSNYRFYPIPNGVYTIRERYWKQPTTLTANDDTSDLPIEVENCIIQWALGGIYEYLNKFESADRATAKYVKILEEAMSVNRRKIDKMIRFGGSGDFIDGITGIFPPQFPQAYGRRVYRW